MIDLVSTGSCPALRLGCSTVPRAIDSIWIDSDTDIWARKAKVNPFGFAGGQPVRVEFILAPPVRAHTQAQEIRVCNERDERNLHLAPVADSDGDRCESSGVKESGHGYLVYTEMFGAR